MSVAFGSITNLAYNPSTGGVESFVFTKPTGLTAGDMMVAVMGNNGDSADDMTAPAGWSTLFSAADGNNYGIRGFCKVADSADASATDFTFTNSVSVNDSFVGFLVRLTGDEFAGTANIISSVDVNNSAASSHTYTPGLTPTATTSLFILGTFVRESANGVSNYAITNNNPTWTERTDIAETSGIDASMGMATASVSVASNTGDFTLNTTNSKETIGFLLVVSESVGVNPAPAVITATASVQAPTVTGGSNASPAVITATATVQSPTVTVAEAMWNNQDKNISTWLNEDKS